MTSAELIETFREEMPLCAFSDKFQGGKVAFGFYSELPDYLKDQEVKTWDMIISPEGVKVLFVVVKEIRG